MAHSIQSLVEALNSKAAAAGVNLKASKVMLSCNWGDEFGIRLEGQDKFRGAEFARRYFEKHLAPLRTHDSQYHFIQRSDTDISLVYYPCAD